MSDPTPPTAQIIAFPGRLAPPPVTDEGQERLKRAMASLEAAVVGQRSAVAAWRDALEELRTVMSGLGGSMQRYRDSLDVVGDRVAALHSQAVQLERTADAAMAASPD
jgi:hypothetical protein